eukprot:841487-Prymnesium_polylepis.1
MSRVLGAAGNDTFFAVRFAGCPRRAPEIDSAARPAGEIGVGAPKRVGILYGGRTTPSTAR